MDELRFSHLGMAVAQLGEAVAECERIFGQRVLSGPVDDPAQQARVCFVHGDQPGDIVLELVAPLSPDSHVARMLHRGISAYHVCYEVDNMEQALGEVRAHGCAVVHEPVAAVAYGGRRIAWFYTPSHRLVEVVER
jgi:catechol 2,3-dioxygenase-like lactoylglutathione lyase family enzyme